MVITNPDRSPGSALEALQPLGRAVKSGVGQSTTPTPAARPSPFTDQKPAFYELDRYSKYRDPFLVVGFGLVVYGVWRMSIPFALILAGLGLMKTARLMSL